MSEVFLDIETTGLSFRDNHKIVEIACVETKELIPTKKIFHTLINPERDVPDEAFRIHGHSSDLLKKQPTFKEVATKFLTFIEDKELIIHNASFDIPFINYELENIKIKKIDKNKIIDSLEIARGKFPGVSNSLDALCKRFGIDLSRRKKHNALLDCELLREVYINLIGVREPKLSLNNHIEEKKHVFSQISHYSKKIIKPSESELQDHKLFLKNELKKNHL